jgi:type IV secretory pathway TrbL component
MPACLQTGNLHVEFSFWFVFANHARFNHKKFRRLFQIAIRMTTLFNIICFW